MEETEYLVSLGRSFTTPLIMLCEHIKRHDALDGPECLLLPEEPFLDSVIARLEKYPLEEQTPDKKYSQEQELKTEYPETSFKE